MTKAQRVGYFGGTFDPPHLGHEILAREAHFQLDLNRVHWLITPDPPHKLDRPITPVEDRLPMLELAVGRFAGFEISLVDLERKPPYFAADTVKIIKNFQPEAVLVYLIGEDSLRDLPEWHQPEQFISTVDLIAVAPRPEVQTSLVELEKKLPGLSAKTVFLEGLMVDISSSLIRKRFREGNPYQHFLVPEVADYLARNPLYRD